MFIFISIIVPKISIKCFNVRVQNRSFLGTLADLIFVLHLTLVVIVVLGWLIPRFFYLHLILLTLTALSEVFLGYCLLSRMEFSLRKKLNPTLLFDKSCIVHYLRKWRGLRPRPKVVGEVSFLKKNSFLFILLGLGLLSFVYRSVLY